MTPRIVTSVAVALLLLTAGCLGAASGSSGGTPAVAPSDHGEAVPTLSVSGTGSVTADPDSAVVRFAVVVTADTASAVRELAAQRADGVREALAAAGVADEDLHTTAFSLSPRYDHGREERRLVGYTAVHAFEVTVPDVGEAGAVVDAAVAGGADRVDGVRFTLAEETREALRADAVAAAVADARADADAAADAAGVDLAGVHSMTVGSVGYVPVDARYTEAAADGTPTTFSPGPVTVTATVSVRYALAE